MEPSANLRPRARRHPWLYQQSDIGVVALAASAGGLAGFRAIVSRLPAEFPAPVLVCQHRITRVATDDLLVGILRGCRSLAVEEARYGTILRPGTVYVAPPNRHLLVRGRQRIALSDSDAVHHNRPSIDLLFESLATQFGPRVIAVVLSGHLSDGAVGIVKVKARGGTVLVQDPATAACKGMPMAAIASGCADFVLPAERIADALTTLAMVPGATGLFATSRPAWVTSVTA